MAACTTNPAKAQIMLSYTTHHRALALLLVVSMIPVDAIDAAIITDGTVPARGWSSWNTFRCDISESLIKEVADAMVASGLRDAGYVYLNIDDCWMDKRDQHGVLQPFASKFPSGMKALADYVHSLGLKLGLYSDAGNKTCEGYPGSWGHEVQDARTFAEWGVDYLKYDYCGMPQEREAVETAYHTMSVALAKSGRRIVFSMCSWGAGQPWEWAQGIANSWRVSPDLFAAWDREQADALHLPNFLISVMEVVEIMADKHAAAQPGSFNDGDMLVVGLDGMYPYGTPQRGCPSHLPHCTPGQYISREVWGSVGGLTLTQQRSHFSLWVMLSSPLILGNDPRFLRSTVLEMLTATEVLKIHADVLGKQAQRVYAKGPVQFWRKQLEGSGKFALLVLNAKNGSVDSTTVWFAQHFSDMHGTWARNLPVNFTGQSTDLPCEDEHDLCVEWAADGECKNNPGFMLWKCRKSCPSACSEQAQQLSGPQASALVRDVWSEEDLGLAVGRLQVKHLEPYECRLFVLQFVDPIGLGGGAGGIVSLIGGGIAGTAGYSRPTSSARSASAGSRLHVPGEQATVVAAVTGSSAADAVAATAGAPGPAEAAATVRRLDQKRKECEWQIIQVTAQLQQLKLTLAQVQQQVVQVNYTTAAAKQQMAVAQQPGEQGGAPRGAASRTGTGLTDSNISQSAALTVSNSNRPTMHVEAFQQAAAIGVNLSSSGHGRSSSSSSAHEHDREDRFVAPASSQQQSPISAVLSGLIGMLAVNVCVLCFGFVLGLLFKQKRSRYHRGYFKQQHQNP